MRKVEIKSEKHDNGWIAVERVNNRIVWKSSNFAVEELARIGQIASLQSMQYQK